MAHAEKPSSRSCLTTTTLTVPMPNAHPSSAQQRLQTPPRQRLLPRRLPTGCPSTVSERFFLILLRSRKIRSKTKPAACPSSASLAPHPCSTKHSTCSKSTPARCKQYTHLSSKTKPMMPTLTLVHPWKVRLMDYKTRRRSKDASSRRRLASLRDTSRRPITTAVFT